MRVRRRLCRALLAVAAALPGAVATLPATSAAAADPAPPLAVAVVESCRFLLKGTPMAFRVRVVNQTSAVLPAVSVTPDLPAGFTSSVEGEPTPLPADMMRIFTVMVTAGPSVPAGPVSLRFTAAAGAATGATSYDRVVVDTPIAPENVTAVAGDGVATVSWTPGAWTGLPIGTVDETGYDPRPLFVVTASPGGAVSTVRGVSSAKVAGLANGTPHTFTVTAVNEFGRTESAASAAVVPRGMPGVVPEVAVAGSGASRLVTWSAPPDNGSPVTGYTVTATPGDVTATTGPDTRAAEVTGLDPETTYTFAVRATNAAGTGEAGVPPDGRPTSIGATVTLLPSGGQVEVSIEPDPAAPPVDGWLLRFEPTGEEVFAERVVVPWLPAGYAWSGSGWSEPNTTFTVSVRAVNAAGTSPAVVLAPATTGEHLPGVPTSLDAVSGEESVHVCFAAGPDLGADVAGFVIDTDEGPFVLSADLRVATLRGLTTWRWQEMWVGARVADGGETGREWTAGARPYGRRAAPQVSAATPEDGAAVLEWDNRVLVPDDGAAFVEIAAEPGGPTHYAAVGDSWTWISPLTNGTPYTFTIRVLDENGYGGSTVAGPVTPAGLPGTVPALTVTPVPGDPTSATVQWSPAAANGSPILRYEVFYNHGSGPEGRVQVPGGATSAVARELVPGETYDLGVRAVNDRGEGEFREVRFRAPDTTPPVLTLTPLPAVALSGTARVTYSATDASPTGITYDVRYRAARHDSGFGPYRYPASWQGTAATTRGVTPMPGTTYCFGVRARDVDGNVTPWSGDLCTTTPVDDPELVPTAGWARRAHPETFGGTYSVSGRAGSTLTLPDVRARRLSLVAIRCAVCGDVGVYVDGVLVRRWSLRAPATAYRQVLSLDLGSLRTGTVTLKVLSGRVHVDAIAARPV
ncbi:MAG TPA: fibronectin type III domain-containing protein [Frankiaceae bacterium]|nr:fibronectin type III domain-containing protein [Frankiaceae bacterium]